jgi:hypothetical protein
MPSSLAAQLMQAAAAFEAARTPFALIGGMALASHGVLRGTRDIDFLVDAADGDTVDRALKRLGYECAHRSTDAATYVRGSERIDLLYAHRPIARKLLGGARAVEGALGRLRVVSGEGLIAFKLQAIVNDPARTQDLEDIRALLRANLDSLDMDEVREYFRLFDRESDLDGLLQEIG